MPLILLLIGLVTGVVSGLFGIGGGLTLVPLLTLTGVPIKQAIAVSLLYIVGVALGGVYRHFKQQTLDLLLAAPLCLGSILTAQIGANLAISWPASLLKFLFGLLAVFVAVLYLAYPTPEISRSLEDMPPLSEEGAGGWREWPGVVRWREGMILVRERMIAGQNYVYRINLPVAFLIGLLVGLISGLFGVGGGFLMVPMMVSVLRIPIKVAVGTSLVSVIPPALSGSLVHWLGGTLEVGLLPLLLVGGIVGVQIGSRLVVILKDKVIKLGFAGLLFSVSAYMLALGFNLI